MILKLSKTIRLLASLLCWFFWFLNLVFYFQTKMVCCCNCGDEPLPEINGVKKEGRGCTDVAILLIFVGATIASYIVFGEAIQASGGVKGWQHLVYGVDLKNRVCGIDAGVEVSFLLFFHSFANIFFMLTHS